MPSSAISTVKSTLKTLLANNSDMRTWLGAASVPAAEAMMFKAFRTEPTRPWIVIETEDVTYTSVALDSFLPSGSCRITVQKDIGNVNQASLTDAEDEIDTEWGEFLDILKDVLVSEASGVRINAQLDFSQEDDDKPRYVENADRADTQKPYESWQAAVRFTWGVGGGE